MFGIRNDKRLAYQLVFFVFLIMELFSFFAAILCGLEVGLATLSMVLGAADGINDEKAMRAIQAPVLVVRASPIGGDPIAI